MKHKYLVKAERIKEKVIEYRRKIHSNPELAFKEVETARYIRNILDEFGIENEAIAETGVVAHIGSGNNCVALRADIDALPIAEETNLDFSSKNEGIMHACGHDLHTAMLLGSAVLLKEMENELKGVVKLIFQPAEEKLPGGASILIKEGVLENPRPMAVFGQHIDPKLSSGKIALSSGYVMGSADELYWTINGKGSHAAQPHLANDAVLAASQIVLSLQTLVTKFRDPLVPGLISVTSIQGGTAPNIFPEEIRMMGTMRTFDNDLRDILHKKIAEVSNSISELYGCNCNVNIVKGYPPLRNNEDTTNFVKKISIDIVGSENVLNWEPKMWAEDFAYYAQAIPSTFWFLGANPSENPDAAAGLHNPKLKPDEKALLYGTALMLAAAVEFLEGH